MEQSNFNIIETLLKQCHLTWAMFKIACDVVKHMDLSWQKDEKAVTAAFLQWPHREDPVTAVSFITYYQHFYCGLLQATTLYTLHLHAVP